MTPNRFLYAVLFLSLAGNIFMGGYLLGGLGRGMDGPPSRVAYLRENLPPQDRAVIEDEIKRYKPRFEALKSDLDAAATRIREALHEGENLSDISDVLRDEAAARRDLLLLMQEARQSAMEKLSPDGRAVMEKMPPPGGRRHADMPPPFIWE